MVSNFVKGLSCLFGAFLIHFSLGTIYTFGNMSPYVVSYLRLRTSDSWVTPGHMVWIFALTVFSQGFTMALGGILEKKIGTRWTCLIGCWTMSFSIIFTYLSIKRNFWSVIASYGFFFGMGTGLTYSVALAAPMKWFPLQKGLVAGTVVAGYGLGSLLFNLLQTSIINPNNISPNTTAIYNSSGNAKVSKDKYFFDNSVLDKVPICFLITGIIIAIIQLIGVIILINISSKQNSPEEETLINDSRDALNLKGENINDKEYTVTEALRRRQFWILWSTFFLNGIAIVTISSLYKAFGIQFISDDRYFAIVGAVAAIFNAGGRVFWGRLVDMLSYRIMMSAMTISMAVMMSTFYLCSFVTSATGVKFMYFLWVCLLFFCLSGSFALLPAATSQTFGNENLAVIYGLVFAGYSTSAILGAIVTSMLFKIFHYVGQFTMASAAALLSLLITQFFKPIQ